MYCHLFKTYLPSFHPKAYVKQSSRGALSTLQFFPVACSGDNVVPLASLHLSKTATLRYSLLIFQQDSFFLFV